MTDHLLWDEAFKKFDRVEYIEKKQLVAVDPTADVGSARPRLSLRLGQILCNRMSIHHGETVLMPHGGCWPLLLALRGKHHLTYWLVEQDVEAFQLLFNNDDQEPGNRAPTFYFDPAAIWNMDFDDWMIQFPPSLDTLVDRVFVVAPPYRAAVDMIAAWSYVRVRGVLCAFIPHADLFGTDANGKAVRRWCRQHDLHYGIPNPGMIIKDDRTVCIFGDKAPPTEDET